MSFLLMTSLSLVAFEKETTPEKNQTEIFYIKSTHIVGNRTVSEDQLLIGLKPGLILAKQLKATIEEDAKILRFHYYNLGYAAVRLTTSDINAIKDINNVNLSFQIEEGPRFEMGKVSFTGSIGFKESDLLGAIKIKGEKFFSYGLLTKDLEALIEKYKKIGYTKVNITPEANLNESKGILDIVFKIETGPKD